MPRVLLTQRCELLLFGCGLQYGLVQARLQFGELRQPQGGFPCRDQVARVFSMLIDLPFVSFCLTQAQPGGLPPVQVGQVACRRPVGVGRGAGLPEGGELLLQALLKLFGGGDCG